MKNVFPNIIIQAWFLAFKKDFGRNVDIKQLCGKDFDKDTRLLGLP